MPHVVLAVDDDEDRAVLQAERVRDLEFSPESLRVTVLHVFTENREGASVSQFGPAREARDVLEDAGIEVSLDERSGEPEVAITRYAEREEGADLICVAGRKRSPAGKAMFGSVSQSIMLDTDLPVLFCPFDE